MLANVQKDAEQSHCYEAECKKNVFWFGVQVVLTVSFQFRLKNNLEPDKI